MPVIIHSGLLAPEHIAESHRLHQSLYQLPMVSGHSTALSASEPRCLCVLQLLSSFCHSNSFPLLLRPDGWSQSPSPLWVRVTLHTFEQAGAQEAMVGSGRVMGLQVTPGSAMSLASSHCDVCSHCYSLLRTYAESCRHQGQCPFQGPFSSPSVPVLSSHILPYLSHNATMCPQDCRLDLICQSVQSVWTRVSLHSGCPWDCCHSVPEAGQVSFSFPTLSCSSIRVLSS